jgi:hydroxymethylpyrimidine pyrophosphatase-like HAD family hydrolase
MIISIDFDGTIVFDRYPEVGPMKPLVKEVIEGWKADGHIVLINSCRTGRYEAAAVDFLLENQIPFDYMNCNHPGQIVQYKMDCRKLSADLYIDDKNLDGIPEGWGEIDYLVRRHKLYKNAKV